MSEYLPGLQLIMRIPYLNLTNKYFYTAIKKFPPRDSILKTTKTRSMNLDIIEEMSRL